MAYKQQPGWQFKFTFGLSIVMFFLVIAYFVQSFHEMRRIQPVQVAIERLAESKKLPELFKGQLEEVQEKKDIVEQSSE
jgi:hypothetical protein